MQRDVWRAAVGAYTQALPVYRQALCIKTEPLKPLKAWRALQAEPTSRFLRCFSTADHYQTWSFYLYHFIPLDELDILRNHLIAIGKENAMLGRIYVSKEGINAQLAMPNSTKIQCQQQLEAALAAYNIKPNWIRGFSNISGPTFRQLHVKVRAQLVADDIDADMTNSPLYLDPKEWHERLASRRPAIVFDQRNAYESAIGHFENAITPNVGNFRDSLKALDKVVETLNKNEEIYLYCTGGIRCTRSGSLLKSQGYENIYVLKGGITAYATYVQKTRQNSLFKGANFTFDKRPFVEGAAEKLTDDLVGNCATCGNPTNSYRNCASLPCNALFLQCEKCAVSTHGTCGNSECFDLVGIDLRKFGMRNKPIRDLQRGRTRAEAPSLIPFVTREQVPKDELLHGATRGEAPKDELSHAALY